jgi:hypothetical protein
MAIDLQHATDTRYSNDARMFRLSINFPPVSHFQYSKALAFFGKLPRTHRHRPRCCRAVEQPDELTPFQLTELHALPIAGVFVTA